jgi:Aspartyl protease/PDZ domain
MFSIHKTNTICLHAIIRKTIGIALLSLICHFSLHAQKNLYSYNAKLYAEIPFLQFSGGVVIVRARLDGYPDTLNFIMDTGSAGISLDSMTCVRLHIVPEATSYLIRGIGGVRQLKYVRNRTLLIGGMQVDSLNFHVSDYDILSSVYGNRIDGIIGYSFFSRFIVNFDYDSSIMYVYSKGNIRYPRNGFILKPSIANIPIQAASVRDMKEIDSHFYFDTGAGLYLLLNADFVKDSSLLNHDKKPLPTEAQGMGGKAKMQVTTIREFRMGPYRFKNIPTHIFEDEFNITSYPSLAGLIGNDLLRRFNIIMNYDKRIFYLTPNSHFSDPFDYSYTGMELYWTDGQIRVGDIMKNSPAAQAGFKTDDVIISVNNNMSQNLTLYKSMLQNTGDKVKIIINREPGGVQELNIRVKSIF